MSLEQKTSDGRWVPAIPEPLWVGWRLRKPSCCEIKFKTLADYEKHYRAEHLPCDNRRCPNFGKER